MKVKFVSSLLLTLLVSLFFEVRGQQPTQLDERISHLKVTIQKYESREPSSDTSVLYRNRIKDLREELLGALREKKRILTKLRQEIPGEDSDFTQQVERSLQGLETDLIQTEKGLQADFAVASSVTGNSVGEASAPPVVEAKRDKAMTVRTAPIGRTVTSSPGTDSSVGQDKSPSAGTSPKTTIAATEVTPENVTLRDCFSVTISPLKFSLYEQAICFLARNIVKEKGDEPAAGINLDSEDESFVLPAVFGKYVKAEKRASFIVDAVEAQTDKQTGTGPNGSGTTSLVVKGGVPAALGWAVENGAAVADTTGTTITFRFNPIGTLDLLGNKGFISGYRADENDAIRRFLRKTSVGLSFDANRGKDLTTFTGNKQQLSALSFRYQFLNERDPRDRRYQKMWEQFIATEGVALTNEFVANLKLLELPPPEGGVTKEAAEKDPSILFTKFRDKALQNWLSETNDKLAEVGASLADVERVIKAQLDLLPIKELSPETITALTNFANGYEGYLKAKKDILDTIAKGRVITFDYTNNRAVNAPDTSNLSFIAEGGTGRRIDLTANASLTFFNKKPVGLNINRIRDFQFAGQLDVPLGDVTGIGQSVLSFGGRFERLIDNAITQAGTVMPNTKGDIGYGQLKLTIPIKGTGLRIPFSVTFSNRTELIKEKEIRGNFGFTFDLDTIFAKFKPF